MSWQQALVAAFLLWAAVVELVAMFKDRDRSSGWATVGCFLVLGIYGGLALVLRSGGFW